MEILPHDIRRPSDGKSDDFRALSWSELVARISATRDLHGLLRRPTAPAKDDGIGSFDTAAARHLARCDKNEWRINRDDLTPAKPEAAICVRAVQDAADNNRDA